MTERTGRTERPERTVAHGSTGDYLLVAALGVVGCCALALAVALVSLLRAARV